MNFWFRLFIARFKTATPWSFWMVMLLMIGVVLGSGLIFNTDAGLRIRVGVYPGAAESLLPRIQYYANTDCEIIVYTDKQQMRLDVAAHKLECAYVFPVEKNEPIITYRSHWTVSSGVLDLLMAAALVESIAGELGEEALRPFMETEASLSDTLQQMTEAYLIDGALMEMVLVEMGERSQETFSAPYRRLFKGLTGWFGLLLALLCGMGLNKENDNGVLINRFKITGRSVSGYTFTGAAVVFAATGLFMTGTLMMGSILYPGVVLDRGVEIGMGWTFAFAMAGLVMVMAYWVKTDGIGLVVFIFIAAGLLSGVAFDIREVWAAAGFARFLFPNYYFLEDRAGVLGGMGLVSMMLMYVRTQK